MSSAATRAITTFRGILIVLAIIVLTIFFGGMLMRVSKLLRCKLLKKPLSIVLAMIAWSQLLLIILLVLYAGDAISNFSLHWDQVDVVLLPLLEHLLTV